MADSNLGFGNPYLDQTISDSLGDTTRAWNMAALPAYNSAMIRSGSFGNSGVDQMTQEGARQLQTSLGRQANDFRANNYWQDQNFNKSVYDTSFQQGQQQFNNGLNLLQMQNGANAQNLGFGTTIQNTPMNYWSQFSNGANAIGNGFGTSSGTSSASGSPIMGALGGAQLGSAIGKGWGTNSMGNSVGGWGSQSSPLGGFFYGNGTSGD